MASRTAFDKPDLQKPEQFYEARVKVYPQSVTGTFRRIKWGLLLCCLAVYYLIPFIRWERGPGQPSQAVLVDFPSRRAYFFSIEIWPQEVYYITGLLILAAITLFLMTAVAGRVWCGFLCPQTIWTDLYLAIERFFEGDRHDRIDLDRAPWTATKVLRKVGKHAAWLIIAWCTGGAWVLYFADAPTLLKDLATLQAPMAAYIWIGILTFTTYALAGFMREQVCIFMCPWPRIQAALTDEWAFNVSYRVDRGEPRAGVRQGAQLRAQEQHVGDCIDCRACTFVCPTGTDIRLGSQLSCIQCGLCIDACNDVMAKLKRPGDLIAFDTDINIQRHAQGLPPIRKLIRPRSILYIVVILAISTIMLYSLATRASVGVNVLHDRNPTYVVNSDGTIRNGYTIRLINKAPAERTFEISIEGLPASARLEIAGATRDGPQKMSLSVGVDQTREARALVFVPAADSGAASTDMTFLIRETSTGESAVHRDFFKAPGI
jgi:cytochrome c oxidase accessory protein FixG